MKCSTEFFVCGEAFFSSSKISEKKNRLLFLPTLREIFVKLTIGITLKVLLVIEVGRICRSSLTKAFFEPNERSKSAFLSPKEGIFPLHFLRFFTKSPFLPFPLPLILAKKFLLEEYS